MFPRSAFSSDLQKSTPTADHPSHSMRASIRDDLLFDCQSFGASKMRQPRVPGLIDWHKLTQLFPMTFLEQVDGRPAPPKRSTREYILSCWWLSFPTLRRGFNP